MDAFDKFPNIYKFGINVRYFRKKKKMTGHKLGEKLSYSEAWISNLENHKTNDLPEDISRRLEEVLEVPTSALISDHQPFLEMLQRIDGLVFSRDFIEASLMADKAIEIACTSLGPIDQVRAFFKRGNIEYYIRNFVEAIRYYKKAYEISITSKDWRCTQLSRQNLAVAYRELAKYDLAEQELRKNLEEVEDVEYKNSSLLKLVDMYIHQEKWESVSSTIEQLLSLSIDDLQFQLICLQYKSVLKLNMDRFLEAINISDEVVELSRITSDLKGEVYGLRIKADALIQLGKSEQARSILERALDILPTRMIQEKYELEFLMTFCIDDKFMSYTKMKEAFSRLESIDCSPRILSKMAERLAKEAFNLRLIDDVNEFHLKSRKYLRAIIR